MRVPAIGRLITRPPSTCTIGSGDEPTIVASGCRRKYMYGDGFTRRSTRYTDERVDRLDQIEPLREHDLEDVALEDVLLRGLDRRGPLRVVQVRADVGQLGELVGAAGASGTYGSGRPSSATASASRATAAS